MKYQWVYGGDSNNLSTYGLLHTCFINLKLKTRLEIGTTLSYIWYTVLFRELIPHTKVLFACQTSFLFNLRFHIDKEINRWQKKAFYKLGKKGTRMKESEEDPTALSIRRDRFRGMILGTAAGDSIGLPAEGISRRRNRRLFKGKWRSRLIFGKGMISDDTEHALFVAQALLGSGNEKEFIRRLARSLRWWLLTLPAGVGFGTLRSVLKLWLGFSPEKSGVKSAGNGPAMRIAPVGAFFADDRDKMERYLLLSTQLTHTDPRAATGARAIAMITALILKNNLSARPEREDFIALLRSASPCDVEWQDLVSRIAEAIGKGLSVEDFACALGYHNGISGYIYSTVPVVVYAWYRHFGDYEETVSHLLNCGGDTDTAGAIAGALAGSVVGEKGIPEEWIRGIWEWPRGVDFMRRLAGELAEKNPNSTHRKTVPYFVLGCLLRNALFLVIILFHGFRRLLPPY